MSENIKCAKIVRARLKPRRNIEKLFGRQLHDVPNLALYVTVKVLSIGTDRSEQTVQTQNTLLLGSLEQSDQGLHCLLFHPHLLDAFWQCKTIPLHFNNNYGYYDSVPIFRFLRYFFGAQKVKLAR